MVKSTLQGGFAMNIGERIRQKREQLGYTQEELAIKLGYAGRSSVNKVENSKEVSMKKIKMYADALNTTVAYLMGWEDEFSIESAQTDVALTNMEKRVKTYALKLAALPKEKQEQIMNLIDMLEG